MSARLRIVSLNDVYALASLARVATVIARARVESPADVLLVTVAGDFLAPSLLSSLDRGRGMAEGFRALGVTHVTLGNHEDDLETSDLRERLGELGAKVLLANVEGAPLPSTPSDVVRVGTSRVGLVGGVNGDRTLFRRPPFGGATIGAPNDAIGAEAARLRAEGCTAVVALTHQPLRADRALAASGSVDLVLGGHEHEGYLETQHGAPLVKAPMNATSVVVADLRLDPEGVAVSVRLVPTADVPEDPGVRAIVDRRLEQVHALEQQVLVALPRGTTLSSVGARTGPTSFGTFVCSTLRDTLDAEVALFNGGGLRGDRVHEGRLTYGDLREELAFDNEMVVARMPGAVLADTLRYAHTALRGTGGYLQHDDRTIVDEAGDLVSVAGAPLARDRIYRVAIVRSLLFGLDHVEPLLAFARESPASIPPATTGIEGKVALLRALARPST